MTIFEVQSNFIKDSVRFEERGDYCLEQKNYTQALIEYANALRCFEVVLMTTEQILKIETRPADVDTQTNLLLWLIVVLKNIIKCYVDLKEYNKAAKILKNQQEILPELGRFQASFSVEKLKGYTQICKYTNLVLESQVNSGLNESRGETTASNESDETFNELAGDLKKIRTRLHSLSTGESTSTSSSSCFIATAAYSTSIHPDLDTFREFRDKNLIVNPVGKLLVNIYYKISPSIARYVDRKPTLKIFLRHRLEILAQWMRSKKVTNK